MHRTQILIPDGDWQAIKSIAANQGKSAGELIREHLHKMVWKELPAKRRPFEGLIGIVRDVPDASQRIDEFLYGASPNKTRRPRK